MKKALLVAILIHTSFFLKAQYEQSFVPLKLYSGKSTSFYERLDRHLDSELSGLGPVTNVNAADKICFARAHRMKKIAREKNFVEDKEMEAMLDQIVKRVGESNNLVIRDRMVLILNSTAVNAYCYGRGLFVVTIGLLSRVHSEDELAFIISHEMAHDELRHVQQNIVREVDLKLSKKTSDDIRKIFSDNGTPEDVARLRNMMYSIGSHNRKQEVAADSLGGRFHLKAGYNSKEAVNSLYTLDSAFHSRYSQTEFFHPLDFENYQFDKTWLKPRLSVFGSSNDDQPSATDTTNTDEKLWSIDSLASHPDLAIRRKRMMAFVDSTTQNVREDTAFMKKIVMPAEFQIVEAAYRAKKYDKALFQILELLNRYPSNKYLKSRAAKIFIDIQEAKNEIRVSQYVSRYTTGYPDRLRQVNNFIYNISRRELGEVSYQFMNNKKNFDSSDPSHYYLLWRICQLTFRDETVKKIDKVYHEKFRKDVSYFAYD
jgi:predicted Zn-dependent protease